MHLSISLGLSSRDSLLGSLIGSTLVLINVPKIKRTEYRAALMKKNWPSPCCYSRSRLSYPVDGRVER